MKRASASIKDTSSTNTYCNVFSLWVGLGARCHIYIPAVITTDKIFCPQTRTLKKYGIVKFPTVPQEVLLVYSSGTSWIVQPFLVTVWDSRSLHFPCASEIVCRTV